MDFLYQQQTVQQAALKDKTCTVIYGGVSIGNQGYQTCTQAPSLSLEMSFRNSEGICSQIFSPIDLNPARNGVDYPESLAHE